MGKSKQKISPEYLVSVPLFIETGVLKRKKNYINLNQYRNWHYQVSNNLKIAYKELVKPQLVDLKFNKIKLTFVLYKGSKRKIDRSNVLSIHEKFFCDALVETGCITDDNDNFLESSHYYTGGIDRDNPRVDILIEEIS